MDHFKKTVCVLDTCSIINLDSILLARKDVLNYMRRHFDVHVCGAIRDEFQRHRNLVSSQEASYWKSFLSSQRYNPKVLTDDQTVVGPFYSNPPTFAGTDDAGERGNARVALELLLTRHAGHAVFVTDDERACNGFLKNLRNAFPGVHLWTSVDVILYLGAVLLKEKKTDFDGVRAALRDVYAAGGRGKDWAERNQAEKESLIRNQNISVNNLKLVNRVTKLWRN